MSTSESTTLTTGERWKACVRQVLIVILINIPTLSFGIATGWVSLATGEGGEEAGSEGRAVVAAAAAVTCLAGLAGVPLSAKAITYGRKPALMATGLAFLVCWSMKLWGGASWAWLAAARTACGFAGAAAWSLEPILTAEMICPGWRGAAAAVLVLAHNLGLLLAYIAADLRIPQATLEWWCVVGSALHCAALLLLPESPAFLAARGKIKEATAALGWLRGVPASHPSLTTELSALPPPEDLEPLSPLAMLRELVSSAPRRRAFVIAFTAVVGQEACGIYSIMQFAERVFVIARDGSNITDLLLVANGTSLANATVMQQALVPEATLSPATDALILGAVQFVGSTIALYLVEKVGRRPLLVWSSLTVWVSLCLAAAFVQLSRARLAAAALAAAVLADSLGLQPAPYAMLPDMFHYQYRSLVVMLSMAAMWASNALETLLLPPLAAAAGLTPALAVAAALTAAYFLFALIYVPETRGKSIEEIYKELEKDSDTNDRVGDRVNEKSFVSRM